MLDAVDIRILTILQKDGRASYSDIARALKLTQPTVRARVVRMQGAGIIQQIETRLNARSLGFSVIAFVHVRCEDLRKERAVIQSLLKMPEIMELHHIAGADTFLVKVKQVDNEALGSTLKRIQGLDSVVSTQTTLVLSTIKDTEVLPLELVDPSMVKGNRST